jgi:hypothetical protein
MTYFRSLFINFLAVFLITRIAPGIEIGFYQKVPNLGAALGFAFIVGCLNASVFAFLFIFSLAPSRMKLALLTGVISFAGFFVIALFPFGVRVVSPLGMIIGGGFTWVVAYLTNYFEWHRGAK